MNGICSSHNGTKRESSRMSESIGSGISSKELRTAFVMCWRSFNYGSTSFFLSNKPRQLGLIQRHLLLTESSQCNGCLAIYFFRLCSCQFVEYPAVIVCHRQYLPQFWWLQSHHVTWLARGFLLEETLQILLNEFEWIAFVFYSNWLVHSSHRLNCQSEILTPDWRTTSTSIQNSRSKSFNSLNFMSFLFCR